MSKTLIEVTREATELSGSERLKLARILLDLSESDIEPAEEVQAAWDSEIDRRLQDLKSGKVEAVPFDEVRSKMESRFIS